MRRLPPPKQSSRPLLLNLLASLILLQAAILLIAFLKCEPGKCPKLADKTEALFSLSMTTVLSLLVKLD